MPILSIIIPLKDWENKRLVLLLNSICLLENEFDIEIVIIYSDKNPKSIFEVNNLKNKKVKFVFSEPKGIYNAFNLGLKNVTGDWVMFFGGDDLVLPSLGYVLFDIQAGKLKCNVIICNVAFGEKGIFKPLKRKHGLIFRNWCQQGVIYNKSVFLNTTFDEKYPIQADHKLNIEICADRNITIKYLEIIVAYFNTSGISQSINDLDFWTDMPTIVTENYGCFWGFVSLARRSVGKLLRSLG